MPAQKHTPDLLVAILNRLVTHPHCEIKSTAREFKISPVTIFNWRAASARDEQANLKTASPFWVMWMDQASYWHRHLILARKLSILRIDERLRDLAINGTNEFLFRQGGEPIWQVDPHDMRLDPASNDGRIDCRSNLIRFADPPKPIAALPAIQPIASVLPGFSGESWLCLYAPSATPAALVDRLRNIVHQAVTSPEFIKSAETGGFDVPDLSVQQVDSFLKADAARWRDVAHGANIVLD